MEDMLESGRSQVQNVGGWMAKQKEERERKRDKTGERKADRKGGIHPRR